MTYSSRTIATAFAMAAVLAAGHAAAADVDKGRQKAEQVCAACHGKDGNTPIDPSYPRIAGQHEDYLAYTLIGYRNEWRKNPIMVGQAKQLSDADISNLAAYFARLPGQLHHRR
jgi:cytochrome c553